MDDQDRQDIKRMRGLFWAKFYGEITLAEMQVEIEKIMNKQGSLTLDIYNKT